MKNALRVHAVFILAWLIVAWQRPQAPVPALLPANPRERLDFVLVEVNGQKRLLRDQEELGVVRGDLLRVLAAKLKDAKRTPQQSTLVGFTGTRRKHAERSPPLIDTGAEQNFKFSDSENGEGAVFALVVRTGKQLHGMVYVRLVEPVLRYAELSINGTKTILRDGERLKLKRSDLIKLDKAVTNLESADGVFVRLDSAAVRFMRGSKTFASIPLDIDE